MVRSRDPRFTSDGEAARMVKARKYVHIPRDQSAILQESNTLWFADVRNQPEVITSLVPKHVLEDAKALHIRNNAPKPAAPQSNVADEVNKVREAQREILSQPPQSSPGTPVSSWSTTPPRSDERPKRQLAVYATQIEESFVEPATQSPSQRRTSAPERKLELAFPQSDGPEEEMDVDIPMAETDAQPSPTAVNRVELRTISTQRDDLGASSQRLPNNTPTCAQPMPSVIPCTQATGKAEDEPRPQKRNKPMKRIEFSDDVDSLSSRARAQFREGVHIVRLPNTRRMMVTQEIETSGSTDVGSVIKSTMDEANGKVTRADVVNTPKDTFGDTTQSPVRMHDTSSDGVTKAHQTLANAVSQQSPKGMASQETSRLTETPIRKRTVLHQGTQTEREEPLIIHQKEDLDPFQQAGPPSVTASPSPLTQAHDPYEHFCAVYPDYCEQYNGNFQEFIQACWFLEKLREEKSLKGVLYDDFVRYFSWAYLPQQRENVLAGTEPDGALDSYNILDEEVLFQRRVLRQLNLDLVRKAYPGQFEKANDSLILDILTPNTGGAVVTQPGVIKQAEESLAGETDEDVQMVDDHDEKGDASKPFVCEVCNHRFGQKGGLQRHYRSLHTQDKPFECKKCGKKFARADHLTQHNRGGRKCAAINTKPIENGDKSFDEGSMMIDNESTPVEEEPAPSTKDDAETRRVREAAAQVEHTDHQNDTLSDPREPPTTSTARSITRPASNTMGPPRLPIKPAQTTHKTVETITSTQDSDANPPRIIQSSASLRRTSNPMATQIPPSETSLLSMTSSPARPRAAKKYFDLAPSSTPSSTAGNVKKRARSSNGLSYFKQLQSQVEADPEEKARAARIAAKGQQRRRSGMSNTESVAGTSREGSRG